MPLSWWLEVQSGFKLWISGMIITTGLSFWLHDSELLKLEQSCLAMIHHWFLQLTMRPSLRRATLSVHHNISLLISFIALTYIPRKSLTTLISGNRLEGVLYSSRRSINWAACGNTKHGGSSWQAGVLVWADFQLSSLSVPVPIAANGSLPVTEDLHMYINLQRAIGFIRFGCRLAWVRCCFGRCDIASDVTWFISVVLFPSKTRCLNCRLQRECIWVMIASPRTPRLACRDSQRR